MTIPRGRVFVSPFWIAKRGDRLCSLRARKDYCRHTRSKHRASVGVQTTGPRGEPGSCSGPHSGSRACAGSCPSDSAQGGTQFTQVPTGPAAAPLAPMRLVSLRAPSLPHGSAHLPVSSLSCSWPSLHRGSPLVRLSSASVQSTGQGPSAEPPLAQSVVGPLVQNQVPHAQETARGCWAPCGHSAACSGGGPFLDEGPSKDQARLWCPQTLAHPSVAVTVHPCRPGANRDSSWPLPDTTRAPSIKKLSLTSQSGQNSKVSCYSL